MTNIKTILIPLLILAFLTGLGWLAWRMFRYLQTQYAHLNAELAAAFVIGAVILLICTLILSRAIRHSGLDAKRQTMAFRQSEHFQAFISAWVEPGQEPSWHPMEIQLAISAAPNTMKAFTRLKEISFAGKGDSPEGRLHFEAFLKEARRELGTSNQGLMSGDMSKLLFAQ